MNDALISTTAGKWLWVFLEASLVILVLTLAVKKELIRDSDPKQSDFRKRPYSMAKAQLAFWVVIIIGCFLYVYFSQGIFIDVVNETALVLLGISTITTGLSAVTKSGEAKGEEQKSPVVSEGFWDDILSDNVGINVHRLQMAIWTVVFGLIFIHQVANTGKFPSYDYKVYVLMGMSSITYIAFKKLEK